MTWDNTTRDRIWSQIDAQHWDLVVIGGGITGVGILREASRRGLRALLVEMKDFAWGTSSRSSKMVHGGLRYLATGQIGLTRESVRERQQLLTDGPGLIDPLGFLIAAHKGDKPGRFAFGAGLALYDLLALQWSHRYYTPEEFRLLAPHIKDGDLQGGFRYGDAQTDDARLVMRVIQEAVADGATAINYVKADGLIYEDDQAVGVILRDTETEATTQARARVVVNATGAWSDRLREDVGGEARMRPLRGSHLVFPAWRLPVAQAISFLHPVDRRPVFAFPWEGVTLLGTTDIDHDADLYDEPCISPQEVAYLMAAVEDQFPGLQITLDDVVATWAGVRPVVGSGKADPSKESRDYVLWQENGLLTVTGGKLTTFRAVALNALKQVRDRLPEMDDLDSDQPVLDAPVVDLPRIQDETIRRRLIGRYGALASHLVAAARDDEFNVIPGTQTLWAELRWAARSEGVLHLEDLLLRRTRLGLLMYEGGLTHEDRIRAICQPELGWSDARWEQEVTAYRQLWHRAYFLPARPTIPDWHALLADQQPAEEPATKSSKGSFQNYVVLALAALLIIWWQNRKKR
jgi:glycerol-3-phosphate dehydrogenase